MTVLGENELFLTETVFVEPAWAGTTATATPTAAVAAIAPSLRSMGTPSGWLNSPTPMRASYSTITSTRPGQGASRPVIGLASSSDGSS